jgi:site-specific DNA recombinase
MQNNLNQQPIQYCLYARKSTEDDERQAMSIDSQINEMTQIAIREKFYIKEIRQEKHSAKASGMRPVFSQLINDIRTGIFNGILTWAPDRLSRNAGDLGMLVDLMDQGKLMQIKTYSQNFSNNPNEKFLLMILCSQAKLENDNRGINVKRGMRAKCAMGWRPMAPPMGYLTNKGDPNKLIIIDPERAFIVKQMFERVATHGHSGRTIKHWLDRMGFKTRNNVNIALSKIYLILKNTYYYGKFEYPLNSGVWYKGKHEPLISKATFDKVQIQLQVPAKTHNKKLFPFKKIFICGGCRGGVTAEEKDRKLKYGGFNKHIYYHCARAVSYECNEPYISQEELTRQLMFHIDQISFNVAGLSRKLEEDLERYTKLKNQVLHQEYIAGNLNEFTYPDSNQEKQIMIKNYLKHILSVGNEEEQKEIFSYIKTKFLLSDRNIIPIN